MLDLGLPILFVLYFSYFVGLLEGLPIVEIVYLIHQLILLAVRQAVLMYIMWEYIDDYDILLEEALFEVEDYLIL